MRRFLTWVMLSVLAVPVVARSDGSIAVNGLAGAAKPFGDIANGIKVSDNISWEFPLEAQLQFRIFKQLAIGAYGRYAPTSLASSCQGCTLNDLGIGGIVEYRFSGKLEGGPYLGLFAGWEQLKWEIKDAAGVKTTTSLSGFQGGVTGGMDFELGGLTMGPWIRLGLGEYTSQSAPGRSSSIASKGMHGDFGGGIRISLLL